MVRSIWIVISTMAIANLFLIAGFVGWLHTSGRLDSARVERVRLMLAPTIAEEQAEQQRKETEAAAEAAAAEANAQVGTKPLSAEQKIAGAVVSEEVQSQQARRVQRETADLINTLLLEREELDRRRAAFQREVEAFEAMRKMLAEEEGSEQFQKAVQIYQSVKSGEAKNMMGSLIRGGKKDQVVSYLNALPPRTTSKIIAEFEKEDPAQAADLLERLRILGTALAGPTTSEGQPVAAGPPEGQ